MLRSRCDVFVNRWSGVQSSHPAPASPFDFFLNSHRCSRNAPCPKPACPGHGGVTRIAAARIEPTPRAHLENGCKCTARFESRPLRQVCRWIGLLPARGHRRNCACRLKGFTSGRLRSSSNTVTSSLKTPRRRIPDKEPLLRSRSPAFSFAVHWAMSALCQ